MHNYGLDKLINRENLGSDDIKKVILVNARECRGKITIENITERLVCGLGNREWAEHYATELVVAVVTALIDRLKEVEITSMFKYYHINPEAGEAERRMQHQKIIQVLMECLFETELETNYEIKVKLTALN